MPKILGIDTASDDLTRACLDVRDARVYPALAALGAKVVRLTGAAATDDAITLALTPDVDLVTACGHGRANQLVGRTGPILQASGAVAGKIVHLLACNCGAELGPAMVANGCRAFFGYTEEFMFPASSPGDFLECDAMIDSVIAQRGTAEDAFRAAIRAFDKRIKALRAAGSNRRASLVEHNRNCLAAPSVDAKWGDPGAKI